MSTIPLNYTLRFAVIHCTHIYQSAFNAIFTAAHNAGILPAPVECNRNSHHILELDVYFYRTQIPDIDAASSFMQSINALIASLQTPYVLYEAVSRAHPNSYVVYHGNLAGYGHKTKKFPVSTLMLRGTQHKSIDALEYWQDQCSIIQEYVADMINEHDLVNYVYHDFPHQILSDHYFSIMPTVFAPMHAHSSMHVVEPYAPEAPSCIVNNQPCTQYRPNTIGELAYIMQRIIQYIPNPFFVLSHTANVHILYCNYGDFFTMRFSSLEAAIQHYEKVVIQFKAKQMKNLL